MKIEIDIQGIENNEEIQKLITERIKEFPINEDNIITEKINQMLEDSLRKEIIRRCSYNLDNLEYDLNRRFKKIFDEEAMKFYSNFKTKEEEFFKNLVTKEDERFAKFIDEFVNRMNDSLPKILTNIIIDKLFFLTSSGIDNFKWQIESEMINKFNNAKIY